MLYVLLIVAGSVIAANYVETDWGLSFMIPGLIMGIVGFFIFLLLVANPVDVYCASPRRNHEATNSYRRLDNKVANYGSSDENPHSSHDEPEILIYNDVQHRRTTERSPMLQRVPSNHPQIEKAIGFFGALRIPGVIEYSLSLFFAKLVSYTFLYWLPLYIESSSKYSP